MLRLGLIVLLFAVGACGSPSSPTPTPPIVNPPVTPTPGVTSFNLTFPVVGSEILGTIVGTADENSRKVVYKITTPREIFVSKIFAGPEPATQGIEALSGGSSFSGVAEGSFTASDAVDVRFLQWNVWVAPVGGRVADGLTTRSADAVLRVTLTWGKKQ